MDRFKQAPLVIVEVTGGLGNQLFQYAAGRALADRLAAQLILDISWFDRDNYRRYCLQDFQIRAGIMRGVERNRLGFAGGRGKRFAKKFVAFCCGYLPLSVDLIEEVDHEFIELPGTTTRPIYMKGYWQNIRYFANDMDCIHRDLKPFFVSAGRSGLASQIVEPNTVAVHVRRTDYLSQRYNVCGREYYQRAIQEIRASVADPHLVFFSDDIEWVRHNLRTELPATYIQPNVSNPVIDLWLMAQCRHRILANSSFSWWAAWLGTETHGTVIAPEIWLRGKEGWSPALPHWTLISNDT